MAFWVTECPRCGYVHSDIRKDASHHREYLTTEEYRTCEHTDLKGDLARRFYRYGLILLRENRPADAYDAFLWAAWSCDDQASIEEAKICRSRAIGLYDPEIFDDPTTAAVRQIDVLRRAGRFEEAIAQARATQPDHEILRTIVEFQTARAAEKDTGCYRVQDCVK